MKRIFTTLMVLCVGLFPSLLLFIWVERNTALPWIGPFLIRHGLGLPWVFIDAGMGWSISWNLGLIALFGLLHSGLAGRKSISRPVYIIFAGISSLLILLFWQPTGIVLYQIIPSATLSTILSLVLYWSLLALSARSLLHFDSSAEFVGLKPSVHPVGTQAPSTPKLITTGIYSRVRHPAYLFTVGSWLLTPIMGLDRLLFAGGMVAYLFIGIRFEEKKLLEKFGDAYRLYREKTPMLIPKLFG